MLLNVTLSPDEGEVKIDMTIGIIMIILMLIMAAFLLNGKGAFLIAGYNTMGKAAQEQYDKEALCRFTGWLLIAVCFAMALILTGGHFGILWLMYAGICLILLLAFGSIIYTNTGKRFLKKDADLGEVSAGITKSIKWIIIILVVTIIGVGVLFYQGEREPTVNIFDDNIQIRAMYGLSVDFSEISNVSLLEQSMREIGVGRRTNGYSTGNTLKGHFTSGLLFVQANESPTIRIERNSGSNIYISFRDGEQTEMLYNELMATIR